MKREMSREEILRLFIRRGAFYYDEVAVEKSSLADLEHARIENYIADHYGSDLLDEMSLGRLLINMKLAYEWRCHSFRETSSTPVALRAYFGG